MIFLNLFFEFFKTGLFAVGGGQATIPFLFDICERTNWFTATELANMIAISESTPGPIGVNMAAYVGFTTAGIMGSLSAVVGLVSPSLIIIILISAFLSAFDEKPVVKTVFKFLRAVALGLISYALYQVILISLFNGKSIEWSSICFCLLVFLLARKFKKIHPLVWILAGAFFGLLFL